jgi:LysR family transcriptional regulator, glycine cleavage system transcriptional activator
MNPGRDGAAGAKGLDLTFGRKLHARSLAAEGWFPQSLWRALIYAGGSRNDPAMPRRLPPLNAIRAFEASARHGGFVAAAQELGVTPAAVSLQIRKLEDFYEAQLFRRLPSGVELTKVGAAIHAECAAALATLESTTDLVSARETRTRIVLSCINSLAHRWLVRALPALSVAIPDHWIEVRAEADPVDFEDGGVDLRITWGEHLYPHHDVRPLFTDSLTPICTPAFAAAAGLTGAGPEMLRDEDLILSWWSPSFWSYPTWSDWFAAAGVVRHPRAGVGPAANMPALAVDMALGGLGVALGQRALAAAELADGRLVAPFATVLPMPAPYALVTPRSARRKRRVARLVAALQAEADALSRHG